jgi:peptidoglycan/LPS O-acetylase OafA/YrhL
MPDSESRVRRKWADIVAMLAAVIALGNAMWGPIIFPTMMQDLPQGDPGIGYNWLAFGVGGILGLVGVIVAQKWPRPARVPLVLGGLMLIAVPFAYRRQHPVPITVSVVLGLAMIGAAPFVGPMPPPRRLTSSRES